MSKGLNLPSQVRTVPQYLSLPADSILNEESLVSDVQLRMLAKVLFKHRLLIGAITLASVVIGLLYGFLVTPLYTAKSVLRISTYESVLSATKIEDVLTQKSRESGYLETQISEITSYSLADRVLQDASFKEELFPKSKARFPVRIVTGKR